jgi:transposase
MAKVRSWAGLDVHARSVLAASMDSGTGELRVRRLSGETSEVVDFCASLPGPTRVAYEAGPTGYGLARALLAAGVECVVAAPGKIERPAQDRVKTDQRDAERVLRLLMIDGLHPVRVPTGQEEALRDVVRAREAVRGDLMRARQRLSKLLLRHDVRYEDTASAWTVAHRARTLLNLRTPMARELGILDPAESNS